MCRSCFSLKNKDVNRVAIGDESDEDDDVKKGLLVAQNDKMKFDEKDIES